MWNVTNSSIKFFDFRDAIFTDCFFLLRNFSASSSKFLGEGFAKLYDKFAVTFFNNKIRKNLTTDIKKSVSSNYPLITISTVRFISGFFEGSRAGSSKGFLEPIKEFFVCICNFKNAAIVAVFISVSWFVFQLTSVETSFPVYNSSEISKFEWIMNNRDVFNSVFMICVIKNRQINLCVNTAYYTRECNIMQARADRLKRLDILNNGIKR